MKSGITRRIDELGRLVVPKEIRYNLGIRDGEPLEIYVENNSIIIKKYSEVKNIESISNDICKIINDVCNVDVMISDRDKIIATSVTLKDEKDLNLIDNHKKLIDERETYISTNIEKMYNLEKYFVIKPIITSNDCSGLVFIISNNYSEELKKYASIIAKLIEQRIDIT